MKFDIEKDLLQNKIPSNQWLVKDTNKKIIRAISTDVKDVRNLTGQEKKVMAQLIDFVRYSQDPILNNEDNEDYLRPAVGLAAPQIGVNKNMFYIRFEHPKDEAEDEIEEYAMINAKIIASSKQITALEHGEGCLSVDYDHPGIVPRAYKIMVEGYEFLQKKAVKLTLRGYAAIVFQHEIDHNLGRLYYDTINPKEPFYTDENWLLI